ncbi:MAG: RDD family protein [Blastochloris sp.]|nr:RDD family protein [Blastochloris sp.]
MNKIEKIFIATAEGEKTELSLAEFEKQVKTFEIQPSQMVWFNGREVWSRADVAFPQMFAAATDRPPVENPLPHYSSGPSSKPIGYAPSGRILAHPGMRILAWLLDFIIINVLTLIAITPVVTVLFLIPVLGWIVGFLMTIVGPIIIIFFYNVYLPISKYRGTPGQLILGMQMEGADGERIRIGQAIGRCFASIVSFIVFVLGFFWAFLDERCQTWHDKWSGTFVTMK